MTQEEAGDAIVSILERVASAPSVASEQHETITLDRGWQARAHHAVIIWRQARGWQAFFVWLSR